MSRPETFGMTLVGNFSAEPGKKGKRHGTQCASTISIMSHSQYLERAKETVIIAMWLKKDFFCTLP